MRPQKLAIALTILALPALVLAGGKAGKARHPRVPPRPTGECVALKVASPQGHANRRTFSVRKHYDLVFSIQVLPQAAQEHEQVRLKLYTPRGFLFRILKAPVPKTPETHRHRWRRPPKPLETSARLPVTGTWITENTLYGEWKILPFLDAEPKPCGRGLSFTIDK